nr:DUF4158 domain-containing protein [Enterobacter cloacae]
MLFSLSFIRTPGVFLRQSMRSRKPPLHYLADQLDADVSGFRDYEWSGRTGARHRKEILNFLGIRRVSATDKHAFSDWLYPHGSDPADATEAAFGWFQQRQVECPADKELERSSFQQFELHLADSLSTDSKMLMEASLSNDAEGVRIVQMRSFFMVKAERWRQTVRKSRSCQSWRCICCRFAWST